MYKRQLVGRAVQVDRARERAVLLHEGRAVGVVGGVGRLVLGQHGRALGHRYAGLLQRLLHHVLVLDGIGEAERAVAERGGGGGVARLDDLALLIEAQVHLSLIHIYARWHGLQDSLRSH